MSRRADREGLSRIAQEPCRNWRTIHAGFLIDRAGVSAFRRLGMGGAHRDFMRDLRSYRLRKGKV